MKNQDESGRSMIEMLGVLGIMGVIMYGAVAGINFGIDVYRVNATYREIDELSKSIIDLSSWTNDYSHLAPSAPKTAADILCENDAFPTCNKVESHWVMTNQWGGHVDIADDGDTSFVITYPSVPKVACKKLKEEAWFKYVCIANDTTCDNNINEISFYSRGSDKCQALP